MKLLRKRRNPALEPKERATGHLFCQLFTNEMTGLYLLALLATANAEAAEQCFISSLDGCLSGVAVKNEWAHAWAKRVVIKNAMRLVVGTHAATFRRYPQFRMNPALGSKEKRSQILASETFSHLKISSALSSLCPFSNVIRTVTSQPYWSAVTTKFRKQGFEHLGESKHRDPEPQENRIWFAEAATLVVS